MKLLSASYRILASILLLGFLVSIQLILGSFPSAANLDSPIYPTETAVRAETQTTKRPKVRRPVILFGPHDRFNFGDLIFEKVVARLLIQAGYEQSELISTGLIDVDMSPYGGNQNVRSLASVVNLSRSDSINGPYDIVFLGGQSLGCTHECGVRMLETAAQRLSAAKLKVYGCAYVIPKSILTGPGINASMSTAVVNSVGKSNSMAKPCKVALKEADYVSFRDLFPGEKSAANPRAVLAPDSAVMTDRLFREEINDHLLHSEKFAALNATTNGHYIAVQLKEAMSGTLRATVLAQYFDATYNLTGWTTVFFRAGIVKGHDSLDFYRSIASHMVTPSAIYEEEHVWGIVGLISKSSLVIGSSLHVRIMSFVHQRPRITFCTGEKHFGFINLWEAPGYRNSCVDKKGSNFIDQIRKAISYEANSTGTNDAVELTIEKYMSYFNAWSSHMTEKRAG